MKNKTTTIQEDTDNYPIPCITCVVFPVCIQRLKTIIEGNTNFIINGMINKNIHSRAIEILTRQCNILKNYLFNFKVTYDCNGYLSLYDGMPKVQSLYNKYITPIADYHWFFQIEE